MHKATEQIIQEYKKDEIGIIISGAYKQHYKTPPQIRRMNRQC